METAWTSTWIRDDQGSNADIGKIELSKVKVQCREAMVQRILCALW